MKSKTIIISALEESQNKGRGILTIYQEDELLKCKLRLYNVNRLSRFCKLAIYHNEQVYSANLIERSGVYESSFVGDFNIEQDFYTALIDTENNNEVILAGGTYQGFYFNDYSVFSQNDKQEEVNLKEENIETCDNCDKCSNCKYKEFFYSQQSEISQIEETEQPQKEIEKENVESVINSIIPQFEYIFNNYNANEELNTLIYNSKFVKINEGQDEYSIGAIYENQDLKYICYAIRRNYNEKPPAEIGEHYQWLPLDKVDPLSEGYYVVFQDAKDLKILEL